MRMPYLLAIAALLGACGSSSEPAPVAAAAPPAPTPAPPPAPPRDFQPLVAAIGRSPVPDIAVIVGTRDGILFSHEKGRMTVDTAAPIASASKLHAALIILRLVEAGVMRLDDPAHRYLDYWTRDPADPRSRVTLAQLLGFTSGFNASDVDGGCIRDATTTLQACAREYYGRGIETLPGAAFAYGPAHMQIAGAMAEAATGRPFAMLLREQLAVPAGMGSATAYILPSASNPRIAGGMQSTGRDSARMLQALLAGRLLRDTEVLTQDRTAGLAVANAPDAATRYGEWHYALGAWRECDDTPFSSGCARQRIISSPGAFGWTPWIDFDRGYWAVIAMEDGFGGSIESVRLEQELQPLIAAALGL